MKSPSLESIYAQLDKHILLAQSYSEIGELAFIIKACRLKPHSYIFEDKNSKLVLHNWWFDEFGNSVKITKHKKLKVIYNDLELTNNKIVCTDLYYGLSLDKVIKMSSLAFVCAGKDEDLLEDYCMISFLGLDHHLRTYIYMYGEWSQVSPLLLGLKNLKTIGKHAHLDHFIELVIKENVPAPCALGRAWLTCLPVSHDFLQILGKQSDIACSILQHT